MSTKSLLALAVLLAACASSHGQTPALNTNAPLVARATNDVADSTARLDISPEVRLQLLQAAADEIGTPETNDLDDLILRHKTAAEKARAIQARKTKALLDPTERLFVPVGTNSPSALLRSSPSAHAPPESTAIDKIDAVIARLAELRAQLSENRGNQPTK